MLNPQVFFIPYLGEQVDNDTFYIPLLICFNESNVLYNQKYYDISVHKYASVAFQPNKKTIAEKSINKINDLGLNGMETDQPIYPYINRFVIEKSKNVRVSESQIMSILSNGDIYVNRIEDEFYNNPLRTQKIHCNGYNPTYAIDIYKHKRVVACKTGAVLLFDSSSGANKLNPISTGNFSLFETTPNNQNSSLIQDLSISQCSTEIIFGVTSKSQMIMWDSREAFVNIYKGLHNGSINTVSLHPSEGIYLATGGSDKLVKIWDLRKLNTNYKGSATPLDSIVNHTGKINQVVWNPRVIDTLASCSDDGKVNIYKFNRFTTESDFLFAHYGHRSPVKWLDWLALNEGSLTIASVSSSHGDYFPCLQVWESDLGSFEY
ncbi:WD40 repeat-like protein [Conidiobolus coronatus NRRL 28638]|uniref:WD40 repeat-like protein n=1 Tax=Conidiobolus coronatus (strain ATCC 28846 / CBS 209.66 / NRRL 28638) TaxID=796925 RepID=A0A137PIA2_CONC2|nr:WD40 repeat-like protein [Conidiobolus coronatus NRRL 28638]|eukprot:KXN74671.1 WD40 repeat-like protein [Conidiobolus coronatus NRRL 28638]